MNRIKKFFSTFLLFELLKGMAVTGKYLFKPKITVHYPHYVAIRMEKNVASHVNYVKRYVQQWQLR